jgi:hypothetical protein
MDEFCGPDGVGLELSCQKLTYRIDHVVATTPFMLLETIIQNLASEPKVSTRIFSQLQDDFSRY